MKKILVIIRREYLTRVRTKAFVIGTIATPVLMLALILVPSLLATRGGGERQVFVLDQSGDTGLFDAIESRVRGGSTDGRTRGDTRFVLHHVPVREGDDVESLQEEYNARVEKDTDLSYVLLGPGILDGAEAEYYAKNVSDLAISSFGRFVSAAVTERRLVAAGFDPESVNSYLKPIQMKTFKVGPEGAQEESGRSLFFVGLVMLFFIYMTILLYGMSVMRGVIEEKQSRIVEVIVSSVRPTQMMLGKVIGIGAVGLTQYLVWVSFGVLLTVGGASMASGAGINIPQLPASLLIYFVLYFILGYFIYATLYAMVGAMVSTEEEAQNLQFPITMLIIVPMLLFTMVMNNPNSGASIVLSMVPFFSPTLMMLRIAMVNPPLWQIGLSMGLMVLAILGCTWLAARIYRVGILMYGKRPSLAELGRWLRYA